MKKRSLIWGLILTMIAVSCLGLTACGGGGGDSAGGGSTNLNVIDSEWYGIDNYQLDSSAYLQQNVGEALFRWDAANSEMVDGVCTDWQVSEDGKTATFNVPEGMYYSTGEQVEPEDVVASLQHGLDVSPYGDAYQNIESMEVNGRQVILHLTGFKSDMMYALTGDFTTIIDKDELDTMSNDELMWGCHPYGMFSLAEYVSGSEVKLVRNDQYVTHSPLVENKGPSAFETIDITFNVEDLTALENLKSGAADLVCYVDPDGIADLEGNEDVVIEDTSYPDIDYIEINTTSGPFTDYNIRKAFALLIDRESACEKTDGAAVPAYSMIYDSMQNFSPEAKDYFVKNLANNPEEGIRLIEEAGYVKGSDGIYAKDGQALELTFYASSSNPSAVLAEALQGQMAEYGIKVNLETIDWNYVHEKVESNEYDFAREGLEWAEPILILNNCYYDKDAPTATDEYYEMVNDIAATVDSAERTKKIEEIQMKMFENLDIIPFYSGKGFMAHRAELQGINIKADGTYEFNDVAKPAAE
ncbi:MAG: ABC transporter substrate-binding protein [Mogibacterium sp.]|nr:ABC transporter substrate-binding protein [Mogibacterium sp.]